MGFSDALKRSLGFEGDLSDKKNNDFAHEFRHEFYEETQTISPQHNDYNIILIRPRTIDDINYMIDQIIEEKNPVILDLSFLEKESPSNFKFAGNKIKELRNKHNAEAVLLTHSKNKHLIIISPQSINMIKK